MHLLEFSDGSFKEIVGKKSAFKDAADFLEKAKVEFDWRFEEVDFEISPADVVSGLHCRYYPKWPRDCFNTDFEGGYTYCDQGRGSFEVYVLPLRQLIAERSFDNPELLTGGKADEQKA